MNLPEELFNRLLAAAQDAARQAHCPYSNFRVGAAVLSSDGEIFSGCNVENASSGLTVCAERVAIFRAVLAGKRSFQAVMIYTPTLTATAPCGACRQVLAEFGDIPVIVSCCDGPHRCRLRLVSCSRLRLGRATLVDEKSPFGFLHVRLPAVICRVCFSYEDSIQNASA